MRWWSRRQERRHAELCAMTAAKIDELVDGEVPGGRRRRLLQAHLDVCVRCGASAETVRELKAAVARVSGTPDPEVRERLLALAADIRRRSPEAAEDDS